MINLNKFLCLVGLALTISVSADSVVVDAAASALAVTTHAQARLVAAKEQANALIEKVKLAVASLQKDGQKAVSSIDLQNTLASKVDSTAQVPQSTTAPIVPPAYQGPTSSTWIAPIVPSPTYQGPAFVPSQDPTSPNWIAPIVPPAYQGPASSTWIAPIVPVPGQTTK